MYSEAIHDPNILEYLGEARRAQRRMRNKCENHLPID